ncbi:transcription initiation factor IIB [Capsaspora owczarzaki ATCC 30864]|uniref:Transcription initiation factor IIB n=1 Tax=Capsaspora owczarzaki (strain ATCC 30864) TaxID=595528 RepID=A0A0D2UBE2_CAPO3|nr:transcription initiation factor IIB [Capsaspora owczarzaki ATCC 30864]KJE92366.1 transcription initiation factor IIB [Capsaspora owczarzaki ATCC 30864]|eukprot:XP_004364187.1 transcription initiation factor IIB [Capsaspora owczarzaki ATCC 30864]
MDYLPGQEAAELPYQTHPELREETMCPECRRPTEILESHQTGDYVCTACGTVVGDRLIDFNSEWRTFANDKGEEHGDPSRIGSAVNPLLNGSDLTTTMAQGFNAESKAISRAHAKTTANQIDRQLQKAFRLIGDFGERMHLPSNITLKAKQIFKQMEEHYTRERNGAASQFGAIVGGKGAKAVAAASLFLACRLEKVSRTYKEITAVSHVREQEISRASSEIKRILGIHSTVVDVSEYVPRLGDHLSLPLNVTMLATQIAQRANEGLHALAGKSPVSIIGASIYMASQATTDHKRTLEEIARHVGSTVPTLSKWYKELYSNRETIFPEKNEFRANLHLLPPN